MDLRFQLQSMRKNNSKIKEYLVHIKSIADHLATVGEIVPDQDLILCTIIGLDPSTLILFPHFQ